MLIIYAKKELHSQEVRNVIFYIIKIIFNSRKDPLEFTYKTEKERDDVFEQIYKCVDHLEWR